MLLLMELNQKQTVLTTPGLPGDAFFACLFVCLLSLVDQLHKKNLLFL